MSNFSQKILALLPNDLSISGQNGPDQNQTIIAEEATMLSPRTNLPPPNLTKNNTNSNPSQISPNPSNPAPVSQNAWSKFDSNSLRNTNSNNSTHGNNNVSNLPNTNKNSVPAGMNPNGHSMGPNKNLNQQFQNMNINDQPGSLPPPGVFKQPNSNINGSNLQPKNILGSQGNSLQSSSNSSNSDSMNSPNVNNARFPGNHQMNGNSGHSGNNNSNNLSNKNGNNSNQNYSQNLNDQSKNRKYFNNGCWSEEQPNGLFKVNIPRKLANSPLARNNLSDLHRQQIRLMEQAYKRRPTVADTQITLDTSGPTPPGYWLGEIFSRKALENTLKSPQKAHSWP